MQEHRTHDVNAAYDEDSNVYVIVYTLPAEDAGPIQGDDPEEIALAIECAVVENMASALDAADIAAGLVVDPEAEEVYA